MMRSSISCVYSIGKRSILRPDWQDYDVCHTRYSKLYYVEKGEIIIQIYDKIFTLGPGDLMLIPTQVVHSFWMPEGGYAEKAWCHFCLKNISGDFFEQLSLEPVLKVKDREYVGRLFDQLIASESMPSPQNELAATVALCSLVQYYLEGTNVVIHNASANRIKKVIDYIDNCYKEKITLEQMAEIACCSPKHLSKCFHEATGQPPIRYLNLVRIEHARYLLQYSNDSIAQIMGKCGFTDAAYFSRVFKKINGSSPQAFRDQCKNRIDKR